MDNSQNAIHAFIPPHPDNDVENENMPELVSLDATGSHAMPPQQETTADVEMNGEDSGVPPLAAFSDSSDEEHDNNHDSESDREAHEVEMQTVNDHRLSDYVVSNVSSPSHTAQDQPAVNNRRARVEDDEDEDRDRRHPSQRIGTHANTAPSAGPSSSTLVSPPSQMPTATPQSMPGVRFRGQAPIFNRTVVDEATTARAHPFRFFQHLMSNNDNDNAGNTNPIIPSGGSMPAPQPHQDRNTQDNQFHGRQPTIVEGFSVTLDIGLGPAFHMGGGPQLPGGEPASNSPQNLNANPNAQNGLPPNANFADLMARFGLIGQAMGLGENGAEETTAGTAPGGTAPGGGNNSDQGGAGAQFGFNFPAGAFNLANLAGLGFGFNLDGSGFGEKEDPERARKLVDGLEEVPVGLVRRLERVGGTGGGMGEDETKGGDGGCAICWDKLLSSSEEEVHWHQGNQKKESESERTQPEASTDSNEASKLSTAKIVSLPCAHVFHAECLIPWFSRPRQTTCPTCRFNIDPENLTYVSWRRRMRERQERERAEASARSDPENADRNASSQDEITPPAPAAAEPAVPPLPDAPSVSEHVLDFLSSLESESLVNVRSQTPEASALTVHPTPMPRSQSQPPTGQATASSSSSSSALTHTQTNASVQEAADDLDTMPGLQEISDSEDEDDNEDEEGEEEGDEEEDEDQEEEDGDEGDGAQEQGNGQGIQASPALPHVNEPPNTSTSGAQAQALRPRQNDPLRPRTIQTAHGLVTLIPVPFSFPFPPAGNGVGVGVQAGGNGANANTQVPPVTGQGRPLNVNANTNTQALPQGHLYGPLFPHGLPFPHSHIQLPHMPEFGAQRRHQGATPAPPSAPPAPTNTAASAANVPPQVIPPAIFNIEEQVMQHLLSQGFTADEAGGFRRTTAVNEEADRPRRGGDPDVHPDPEDEDEDDMMMDIDEGMGMVVDLTMEQGGMGADGAGLDTDPAAIAAQNEQDRQEYAQVLNFLNHAARHAHARGQAQTGPQTPAQERERGAQGMAANPPNAQSDAPPPQQPQQQQQGQGFAPFMAGLNAGFNIGNHTANFEPGDGRTMNDFITQVFANLTGGPQQQARQQAPAAQGQSAQPQPQPRPQEGQESTEGPNHTNANNNGGRPRQPLQFAFGNVTIGPFTNIGSLFDQIPMFNPNVAANANGQERVKKAWTLPPAPGPTLRQRIERKERDAGLRCYDISCGVGPSDEDPVISDETISGLRQLKIMSKNDQLDGKAEGVCKHTFHPGCLVSAERVASAGANVSVIEGGDVEVSCPVCRSAGRVTKQEWDEGVLSLA